MRIQSSFTLPPLLSDDFNGDNKKNKNKKKRRRTTQQQQPQQQQPLPATHPPPPPAAAAPSPLDAENSLVGAAAATAISVTMATPIKTTSGVEQQEGNTAFLTQNPEEENDHADFSKVMSGLEDESFWQDAGDHLHDEDEEYEEEEEEEEKEEDSGPTTLSVHGSLERLVDRITEIKQSPWTVFNNSKTDHEKFEQVAGDLGMYVPRSYDEHFSLLPTSFHPSEFEPRSVLHSMLALIGGFSWSPLRRRQLRPRLGGAAQQQQHKKGGKGGSTATVDEQRRSQGPINLARLFEHFTAAALRVHVVRHRAINSGTNMKQIAESATLLDAISQQIDTEVDALSKHLTQEQMSELPVDRVAFRETMDAFLFEQSGLSPPLVPMPAAAAASSSTPASGTLSPNNNNNHNASVVSFTMSAFLGPDDLEEIAAGGDDKKSKSQQQQQQKIGGKTSQAALLSALQQHAGASASSPSASPSAGSPLRPPAPARENVGSPFEQTQGPGGAAAQSMLSASMTVAAGDAAASPSPRGLSATANFLKKALITVVDPDVPFELMAPEARAIAYDAVFDACDVRNAGEITWKIFFAALTQASLLPKLGGLVHHPRILDFSHWILPTKLREVLSNVHHVNTYSKGNAQVVVGHDAALVMVLPRANAFANVAPGTAGDGKQQQLDPFADPAAAAQQKERDKVDAYFSSLRFLATFNKVNCFVNGISTVNRIKQEQPIKLGQLLARARSVGLQMAQQQQHQSHGSAAVSLGRMASARDRRRAAKLLADRHRNDTGGNASATMTAGGSSMFLSNHTKLRYDGDGLGDDDDQAQVERARRALENEEDDYAFQQQRENNSGGGDTGKNNNKKKSGGGGGGENLVHGDRLSALSSFRQHSLPDPQIVQVLVVEQVNVILVSSTDGSVKCFHIAGSTTLPNCELYFTFSISNTIAAITPSWDLEVLYFGTRHGHVIAVDFPLPQRNLTTNRLRVESMPLAAKRAHKIVAPPPLIGQMKKPAKTCKVPDTPYKSYVKEKSEDELAKEALRAVQVWDVTLRAQALPHNGIVSCIIHLEVEHCILSGSYDHTIMLSQEDNLCPLVQYCGHTSGVHKMVHSDDYNFFCSADYSSRPLVWAVSTQPSKKPPMELYDPAKPHMGTVVDCDYIPSSNIVVTLDDLGMVKFWDMRLIHAFETVNVAKFQPSSMTSFNSESGSNCVGAAAAGGGSGGANDGLTTEDMVNLQNLMAVPVRFVAMSLLYEPSSLNSPTETLRIHCYTKNHGACVCEWNLRLKERVVRNAAEDQSIVATFLISTGTCLDPSTAQHEPLDHHSAARSAPGGVEATTAAAAAAAAELSSQILANITAASYRTWDVPSGVMRDYIQHEQHSNAGGISVGVMNKTRTVIVVGLRDGSVFAHNAHSGTVIQCFRRLHRQAVQQIACFSYAPQFNLRRNAPKIMIMSLAQRSLHLVTLDASSDGGVVENAGWVATKQMASQRDFTAAMATTAIQKGVWLELLNDDEEDESEVLSLQYATQKGVRHRVRCFDVEEQVDLVAVGTSHAKVIGFALSAVCASAALRIPIGSIYLPPPRKPIAAVPDQGGASDSSSNNENLESKISTGDLDTIMLKIFPRIGMGLVVTESSRLCLFSLGCPPTSRCNAADSFMTPGRAAVGGMPSSIIGHDSESASPWSLGNMSSTMSSEARKQKKLPNHFEPRACWYHAIGERDAKVALGISAAAAAGRRGGHHHGQHQQHRRRFRNNQERVDAIYATAGSAAFPLPTIVVSPDRQPHLLYVGDDKGYVTLYDLSPLLPGALIESDTPRLVNRWLAHAVGTSVVSIFFLAAKDKLEAMVGTSGADQTVHAFSMSGALYFGSLDLHQRLSILAVPSFVSDDVNRFDAKQHDDMLAVAAETAAHAAAAAKATGTTGEAFSNLFMTREMCFSLAKTLVEEHQDDLAMVQMMAASVAPEEEEDDDEEAHHHHGATSTDHDDENDDDDADSLNSKSGEDPSSPTAAADGDASALLQAASSVMLSPMTSSATASKFDTEASFGGAPAPKPGHGAPTNSRQEQMRIMKLKQEEQQRQAQADQQGRKKRRGERFRISNEQFRVRATRLIAEALRRTLLVPRAPAVEPVHGVPWSKNSSSGAGGAGGGDALHIMESLRLSHFVDNENDEADEKAAAAAAAALVDEARAEYAQHEQQRAQDIAEEQERKAADASSGGGGGFSMSAPASQPKYTFGMYGHGAGGHHSDSDDDDEKKPAPNYNTALKMLERDLFSSGGGGATQQQHQQQHHQHAGAEGEEGHLGDALVRRPHSHPLTPSPARVSRPPSAALSSTASRDGGRCYSVTPGSTRRPPSAATLAGKNVVLARWDKKQHWDSMVPKELRYDDEYEQARIEALEKQKQQQQQQQQKQPVVGFEESNDDDKDVVNVSRSRTGVSFSENLVSEASFRSTRTSFGGGSADTAEQHHHHHHDRTSSPSPSLSRPVVRDAAKVVLERAESTRRIFSALAESPVLVSPEELQRKKDRTVVVSRSTLAPGVAEKRNRDRELVDAVLADKRTMLKPESRALLTKFSAMRKESREGAKAGLNVSGTAPPQQQQQHQRASSGSLVASSRIIRGPVALSVRSVATTPNKNAAVSQQ